MDALVLRYDLRAGRSTTTIIADEVVRDPRRAFSPRVRSSASPWCFHAPHASKIYQGTSLFSELTLLEEPSGLCHFRGKGEHANGAPLIAVSAGPYIFIYR